MLVMVAPGAWGAQIRHDGPWDPVHAAALCIWATYPTLALFGLFLLAAVVSWGYVWRSMPFTIRATGY